MGNSNASRLSSNPNFLSQPITDQHLEGGSNDGLVWGCSCVQGWRSHMEDEHLIELDLPGFPGCTLLAVFDGHAGYMCAKMGREALTEHVRDELEGINPDAGEAVYPEVKARMERAFIKLDAAIRASKVDCGGTTCTSVLLTPNHVFFVNVGDSRTILNRGGKLHFQTRDHKPFHAKERKRIIAAGGYVMNGRVDGGLAVSRALGDFVYKQRPDLSPLNQKVTVQPTTDGIVRLHAKDNFLVLACDGVWDVMSSEAASKFVYQRIKKSDGSEEALKSICQLLVSRCLHLGSRDNISVVIVRFNKDADVTGDATKLVHRQSMMGSRQPTDESSISFSGDASQQSDPDSNAPDNIMGIVGEAVAFSAMQRGLTAHFGGGESRMTRRTTIVETDNMQFR